MDWSRGRFTMTFAIYTQSIQESIDQSINQSINITSHDGILDVTKEV